MFKKAVGLKLTVGIGSVTRSVFTITWFTLFQDLEPGSLLSLSIIDTLRSIFLLLLGTISHPPLSSTQVPTGETPPLLTRSVLI